MSEAARLATEWDEHPQLSVGSPTQGWKVGDQRWLNVFGSHYIKEGIFAHMRRLSSLEGQHCASQIGLPPICQPTTQSWEKKTIRTFQQLTATYLIHSHLREGWIDGSQSEGLL